MTRVEATAAVRRRLVEAAIEQLAEHGMRGLTHRKVEHRAEVAQGSAKYHFGSLDGLVEAVLERMVEVELASVMVVPRDVLAAADDARDIPAEVWQQARAVCAEILSRPALVRARFELYLHAVGRPALQDIIRRGRDRFVARTAASLTGVAGVQGRPDPDGGADAESGARMVLALVDGMVLHHLSAPTEPLSGVRHRSAEVPVVDRMAIHLLATATAARDLPVPPAGPAVAT